MLAALRYLCTELSTKDVDKFIGAPLPFPCTASARAPAGEASGCELHDGSPGVATFQHLVDRQRLAREDAKRSKRARQRLVGAL